MRAERLLLLALGACSFDGPAVNGQHGVDGGPGVDAPTVALRCEDWMPVPHHVTPCDLGLPQGSLELSTLGTYTWDTTLAKLSDPMGATVPVTSVDQPGALVANVDRFELAQGTTLRIAGSRPLIIAAWQTIEIAGTVDVGSHADSLGAGASDQDCTAMVGENDGFGGGSGGGGGGGFQGPGGKGGLGDDDGSPNVGGDGGDMLALPAFPRGGCSGANSGHQSISSTTVSHGGHGGGALQLTARLSITSTGTLTAGGQGGEGAPVNTECGGGGGGAGGYLGFEAPSLHLAGTIAANGGGGGASSRSVAGDPGNDGAASTTPAAGGDGITGCSQPGGPGSSVSPMTEGVPASTMKMPCGGGGGGGGAGWVVAYGPFTGSPAFSPGVTPVH